MSESVLEKLEKAVAEAYEDDPSRPGILVSYIGPLHGEESTRDTHYASIVRFRKSGGREKFVEKRATATSREEAILKLAMEWAGSRESESHEDRLRESLRRIQQKTVKLDF